MGLHNIRSATSPTEGVLTRTRSRRVASLPFVSIRPTIDLHGAGRLTSDSVRRSPRACRRRAVTASTVGWNASGRPRHCPCPIRVRCSSSTAALWRVFPVCENVYEPHSLTLAEAQAAVSAAVRTLINLRSHPRAMKPCQLASTVLVPRLALVFPRHSATMTPGHTGTAAWTRRTAILSRPHHHHQ